MNLKFGDVIYVSIAKNACSTFKYMVYKQLFNEDYNADKKKMTIHEFFYHHPRFSVRNSCKFSECYSFCFVRNPFDRLVSAYLSKIKDPPITEISMNAKMKDGIPKNIAILDGNLKKGMPFDQFIMRLTENPDIFNNEHFAPQVSFLNKTSWDSLNYLGRYETLQEDWKKICEEASLGEINLLHRNKSENRQHYNEYYDKYTRHVVENLYKQDLDAFGYSY
jgi:hypothetical protein